MNNKINYKIIYIFLDFLASAMAWTTFFIYRKLYVEPEKFGYQIGVQFDKTFYISIVLIPLFWIILYSLIGNYAKIIRKSRANEIITTFIISFIGSLVLFFSLLLDDFIRSYEVYRLTFLVLLSLQFVMIYTFRFCVLTIIKNKIKKRKIGFNTLLIGSNENAYNLYKEFINEKYSQGYHIVGYLTAESSSNQILEKYLPNLGNYEKINQVIKEFDIEEIIIATENFEKDLIIKIISRLEGINVNIKMIPDMQSIITGMVKMNYIFGVPLVEILPEIMPKWQKNIKRAMDIILSLLVLILGMPFYIIIAILVKISSEGPIFFNQERIGKNKIPFKIYKFRTMKIDAEKSGPQLSSDFDPRVTKLGRVLRKFRIDEFPQFYNVIKGDMSLVGPRPERQFYIDKIVKRAPHYNHLLKIKPGITSWGQVKYGYAQNVEEMIDRLKFDILYIENMSLSMDFKIIFYTILTVIKGGGK